MTSNVSDPSEAYESITFDELELLLARDDDEEAHG